jgi:hypothetical protein
MDLLQIRSLAEYNAILLSKFWFLLKISICFLTKHQPYSIATMGKMWPLSSFRNKKQKILFYFNVCTVHLVLFVIKSNKFTTYIHVYIHIY